MLTLLVPILISFLLEGNQLRTSPKFTVQLHEQSLQWLMKIGPKYPQVCNSENYLFANQVYVMLCFSSIRSSKRS